MPEPTTFPDAATTGGPAPAVRPAHAEALFPALPGLVNAETCLRMVFPDEDSRPTLRYFRELQAKRLIPWRKIGRLVFFDPVEVRRAIDRQFTVHAR
jgi:hypothetical protein